MENARTRVTPFRQFTLVAMAAFMTQFLLPIQAHAARLEGTAKSSGSKAIGLLLIFTLVIAAITIVLVILSWTTNISWLQQVGTKKMLVGAGGVAGALCFVMLFIWLYQTMTASGGGLNFSWPF